MSAQMKASVLLAFKVAGQDLVKAAQKGLEGIGGAAAKVKGTNALGKMAGEATALAGAADKAAASLSRVGAAGATSGAGAGLAAAARQADNLTAAANRAAAATQKAAAAGAAAQKAASGATVIAGRSGPVPVRGADHERATAIATNLDRANPGRYKGVKGGELLEKDVAEAMKAEAKGGAPGVLGGIANKAIGTYVGYQMVKGVAHGADHTLAKVADVEAMREKLKWSLGGDKAGADAAYAKAMELSGKYKNTTVLENLHIIDDLRANLPETMDHILADATDPFVKMHSFFKGWEGGRHKGHAEGALKEVGAAIRAGELTANVTGAQLADYVQTIATARAVMGDKFKVSDYLTMVRQASIDLAGASKTFQMVDAPVLAQAMGAPRAGTALQSIGQRLVAGNRIQNQVAEGWRRLGLVDESALSASDYNKKGEIVGSHLKGKKWLKDADMLANRPTDFVMKQLMPALERDGFRSLKGAEMRKAWEAKDADKLTHLMSDFTKGEGNLAELRRRVGPLASDPVLAKAIETLFERAPSIARDEQRIAAVPKNLEDFQSYDKAKQAVSAQADRLWQSLLGTGGVQRALTGLAGFLGKASDAINSIPDQNKQLSRELDLLFGRNGDGHQFANDADARAGGPAIWSRWWNKAMMLGSGEAEEIWNWGKLPEGGAAAKAGAVGFDGGEEAGRARAAAAGGRYQLAGSELAEAQAALDTAPPAPPEITGQATAPITIQQTPTQVTFNQAPPNISINVTVNATTNASAGEIGAAAAGQVRSALGGALHDGGQ